MSSNHENLNTPKQTLDKKEPNPTRRKLLIGLGAAGAITVLGGTSAAVGNRLFGGKEAPAPEPAPKPPIETETPTPTETETPVETETTNEQDLPSDEELYAFLFPRKEIGGIGPELSSEEITEHFKPTGSDIEVGNEEQIEQKLNDALALMLNGAPRSSKLVLEAKEYAMTNEDPNINAEMDLLYEYFENVSRDNALAVLNGLAGEDWRFRSRSSDTEQSLERVVDYGKRSLINWYKSGVFNGDESDEFLYQQYFDNQPRPDLFEFTVEPRAAETRKAGPDTKIESEFDVRAKNMQPEDTWPKKELRDDLFDLAGIKFGVELYVDQEASDEAGFVVGRVSLRDYYA